MAKFQPLKDVGLWRQIAVASWRAPNDPSVCASLHVDFTKAGAFLEKANQNSPAKITVTHLVAKTMALVIQKFPETNAIIRWRKLYQRDSIDIFLQVAIEDNVAGGADLSGAKVESCDRKTLAEIAGELQEKSQSIRKRDDPQFQTTRGLLRWVPRWLLPYVLRFSSFVVHTVGLSSVKFGLPPDPFGSAMVTSMGSLGVPSAFAPFFPLGRQPFILCVGEVRPRPWVVEGQVLARPILDVSVTFDHRYLDGFTAARMEKYFLDILNDPEEFMATSSH